MNCLITGASQGLGEEIAYQLASLGNNLFLTYYNNYELCQQLQQKITKKYHVKCEISKLDLKKENNIKKVLKKFTEKYQTMELLVNNAATYNDNTIELKTKEEFMNVLETNVVGTFLMIKHSLPILTKKALIINIASTDGIDTYNLYNLDYAISKAAIIHLTKCLSYIYPNLRTIAIAPNWLDTKSTQEISSTFLQEEMKRLNQEKLIKPSKIANIIVDCLYQKNNITNGEVIKIYE